MAGKMKEKIVLNLIQLGLSKSEANVYLALSNGGAFPVDAMSKKTGIEVHVAYRVLAKLKNKGFIEAIGGYPIKYQAYPIEEALNHVFKIQEEKVEKIRNILSHEGTIVERDAPQTKVDIIVGRDKIFAWSSKMFEKAKSEAFIISIGEEIPEELLLHMRDALQRNVDIRIIAHKYDDENKRYLFAWKKMGIKIRHKPDRGFHLVVFDGVKSLLVANNPDNTRERTGMAIFSLALSAVLREYFMSTWQKAKEIE